MKFNGEDIALHLQSKCTFLKHLLEAIKIGSFGIAIEEALLKMLLGKIIEGNIDMSVWMPQIGDDSLFYRRELSNEYDKYAAVIVSIDHFKQEKVVGKLSLFLSKTLNKFLPLPYLMRVENLHEQE